MYLCVQTESCGFIINRVIVKDEENANYYPPPPPPRRYFQVYFYVSEITCVCIFSFFTLNFKCIIPIC